MSSSVGTHIPRKQGRSGLQNQAPPYLVMAVAPFCDRHHDTDGAQCERQDRVKRDHWRPGGVLWRHREDERPTDCVGRHDGDNPHRDDRQNNEEN